MSTQITQQMQASGVAKVLVFLKPQVKGSTSAIRSSLENHFVRSERSQTTALAESLGVKPSSVPTMRYYPNLGVALGTVDRDGLAALKADAAVEKVGGAPQIRLIRPVKTATASLSIAITWGIKALEIPQLWNQGLTGKGVLVGHLDTGVDGKHAALKNALVDFTEFDLLGKEVMPKPKAYDSEDHGTHTAATIAGRAVSGKSVGVAPQADLASALVIEGGDVIARVLGGMNWAVGKGIRVLSMSLGFPGYWDDFLQLTKVLRARGVLPVFAVGNEYAGTSRSPGNYAQAVSVGALDKHNQVADFSSSQIFKRKKDPIVPDLVAPGVDTISAKPGGGYQLMSGTSMATPHIAGLAALLWQAKPTATVSQIEKAIFASCTLPQGMSNLRANRGIPNAPKALAAL
ncbi:MAG: S8 family serine peptidase [Acidobacteriota bacterium]